MLPNVILMNYLSYKKIIRIIRFSDKNSPNEPIFRNFNILPLQSLIFHRIGIMMYKYANNLVHSVMNTLYGHNRYIHNRFTRQKHLLHINKSNINVYANNFSNTSVRVWNVLQTEMNTSSSTLPKNTYTIIYVF